MSAQHPYGYLDEVAEAIPDSSYFCPSSSSFSSSHYYHQHHPLDPRWWIRP